MPPNGKNRKTPNGANVNLMQSLDRDTIYRKYRRKKHVELHQQYTASKMQGGGIGQVSPVHKETCKEKKGKGGKFWRIIEN